MLGVTTHCDCLYHKRTVAQHPKEEVPAFLCDFADPSSSSIFFC